MLPPQLGSVTPLAVKQQRPTESGPALQSAAGVVTPPRWWRRKTSLKTAIATLAVLSVVVLTAAVFAGIMLRVYLADHATVDAKREIVRTVTEGMTTMGTYTPDDIATLPDRTAQYLDEDFQDQYRKYVASIQPTNAQAQVSNQSKVVGAAVESLDGDGAFAVVFLNTTQTSPQTRDKPSITYLSYRVALQRHDSRWLIAKLTTITSVDMTPKTQGSG